LSGLIDQISDETIKACQNGDPAAFAEVVKRFERPLFAYIVRMGFSAFRMRPEDVVQDVLVNVNERIKEYRMQPNVGFSACVPYHST